MKKAKWTHLGKNKRYLKRQRSRTLYKNLEFYNGAFNKTYRYHKYLRTNYMNVHLSVPKIPHYHTFCLNSFVNQLSYRLYADGHVRSFRQGLHLIREGGVRVDGKKIKNPFYNIRCGSMIQLDISIFKKILASNILVCSSKITTRPYFSHEQSLFPRACGKYKPFVKMLRANLQN